MSTLIFIYLLFFYIYSLGIFLLIVVNEFSLLQSQTNSSISALLLVHPGKLKVNPPAILSSLTSSFLSSLLDQFYQQKTFCCFSLLYIYSHFSAYYFSMFMLTFAIIFFERIACTYCPKLFVSYDPTQVSYISPF